jgi:hypothetical protein
MSGASTQNRIYPQYSLALPRINFSRSGGPGIDSQLQQLRFLHHHPGLCSQALSQHPPLLTFKLKSIVQPSDVPAAKRKDQFRQRIAQQVKC